MRSDHNLRKLIYVSGELPRILFTDTIKNCNNLIILYRINKIGCFLFIREINNYIQVYYILQYTGYVL